MNLNYQLNGGHTLYYSPSNARFGIDFPSNAEPVYMSTELISLRLEISHLCNGACKYCIVFGNQIQNFTHLKMSEVWSWLEQQEWFGKIIDIFIIGGEPMLFFDDIVFILKNFKGTVSFSTNGTLITPERARILKEYNVRVYISLDGKTEEENRNRIYKDGSPMYADIMKGLEHLETVGTRKGLFMVAVPGTVERIGELIKELSEAYKFERIGYSMPHWTLNEQNAITPFQYRDALLELFKMRRQIASEVIQVNWRIGALMEGKVKKFACALHTQQITMLPGKELVRCSKIDHDSELKLITNEQLTNGSPLMQSLDNESPCSRCVALCCCGGGCPYDGLRRFNTIIDKRECIVTPPLIEAAIQEIAEAMNKLYIKGELKAGEIAPQQIMSILGGE